MSAIKIHKDNFHREVLEAEKPVLLDFWAPWCAPCRMVSPTLDEIAGERPDIRVGKVNVDEEQELVMKYRIVSIPALLVLKDGKVYDSVVRIVNTSASAAKISLPGGFIYEKFKGTKPLEIPATSTNLLTITRTKGDTFLLSREELVLEVQE